MGTRWRLEVSGGCTQAEPGRRGYVWAWHMLLWDGELCTGSCFLSCPKGHVSIIIWFPQLCSYHLPCNLTFSTQFLPVMTKS